MFTLHERFINFTKSIERSKKLALKGLFDVVKHDCQSITGHNLRMLSLKYNVDKIGDLNKKILRNKCYADTPIGEEWRTNVINELIDVKHGTISIPHFNKNEINELLELVCIT